MTTRMLIDARHREETRVAVVTGNRIEEFDFESAEHKQIKGNIYLAKVTRVEPSLQAAFVDYGGNRHGFLAFAEIHPDYYQIPKEDRERLLAEEAEAAAEEAALREAEEDAGYADNYHSEADSYRDEEDRDGNHNAEGDDGDLIEVDSDDRLDTIDVSEGEEPDLDDEDAEQSVGPENGAENGPENGAEGELQEDGTQENGRRNRRTRGKGRAGQGQGRGRPGQAKASDEARAKRMNLRRRYKIQDVIHRRQVLLVQVVKEERGNKGAALTSYLSLAGRYCVLMPNTSHGGGISRKIHSSTDRKRLKSIISDLSLPATMGCIIRTAGLARTKPEIKRDFDYLARLWDEIREKTLKGSAPALIHTDSDLVKRAIRDIYNRDIDEVMVEGAEGYKQAKDFMKLLMPSHAKRVQQYADPVPLFQRYNVEDQLNAMYHPIVQLKSGGYIVINPTEALVSIDINSGRSTKEHGIEATALSTNLEAAREIARQLRLRDMAGLVVIDFIDMEHHSNARKVERAMKDALKHDRARIQVGRISGFGLMEMSRQRLRTGVLEASTRECPHCEGTGLVRTASSSALSALRLVEEEAARGNGNQIVLQASQEATIYVLNNKRGELAAIEDRYHVRVAVVPNGEIEGAKLAVSSSGPRPERPVELPPVLIADDDNDDFDYEDEIEEEEVVVREPKGREPRAGREPREQREAREPREPREPRNAEPRTAEGEEGGEAGEGRRRKRRRGRRGGKGREREAGAEGTVADVNAQGNASAEMVSEGGNPESAAPTETGANEERPKSRRGRRGGRRDRGPVAGNDAVAQGAEASTEVAADPVVAEKPKRASRAKAKPEVAPSTEVAPETAASEPVASEAKPKAKRASRAKPKPELEAAVEVAAEKPEAKPAKAKAAPRKKAVAKAVEEAAPATAEPAAETSEGGRTGWWQRTFG
jgi:ribonuclease E